MTTQYDAMAERFAQLSAMLKAAPITTPQAYALAVEALELLTLAIEQYEGVP